MKKLGHQLQTLNVIIISFIIMVYCSANIHAQTFILNEDFNSASGTTPPLEWSNITLVGEAADLWHFDNPGGQSVGYPMVAPFAIFDAGAVSDNGQSEEVVLESPSFDASISNNILLEFDHQFIAGVNSLCKVQAYNGSAWQDVISYSDTIAVVTHAVVDISPYAGGVTNAKLRFLWSGEGSGYWAFDNVSIYAALSVDAGVTSLDNPVSPIAQGIQDVNVSLTNFGSQSLTSAVISWSANGVMQPDYTWAGSIPFGDNQSDINIGTYDFQSAVELKIWSENPNGQGDPNPYNDTLTKLVYPALCGIYTIGGVNPDFQTINDAVGVLNIAGITCPVTFSIRDGVYQEQIVINEIQGSSQQNTITFESESGDSSAVSVQNQGSFIFNLKNTKYINVREIGFLGDNCLIIEQYSKQIHVEHCYFESVYENGVIVRGGAEEISLLNNTFIDGERGLWINQGDINVYPKNIFMTNNVFANQKYAIIGEYANSLFFDGNHITSIYAGIDLRNNNNVQLKNNWVIVTPGPNDWTRAGIYVGGGDTTDIHNNYVSCQGEFPCPGISLNYTYHCEVYFNSINITNTDIAGDNKALWVNCCDQNIVKNNIFNIKHAGYPVYISNSPQNLTLDYNDYCSPSGLIGQVNDTLYYALDTWRVATGQDDHSLAENPYYTSDSDLSMNQILLNNAGIPITGIDYDIDSALRNVTQPDLGAKEYDPCQPDAGINSVSAPTNPVIQGEQNVKVVLQNQGAASLSSAIINWKVNDVIQPPLSWSGTLEINENEEVTLGNYNFQGGVYSLVVWTSQPNGVADCNPNNDTIHAERAVALCGTYTIGGSNPDFTTITEAVTILNIAGVTCPVTFSIRDGIYNEQVVINEIQGSSQQNTITFESESGDSSAVSVQNQGSFIFNLKNTKYINVRKIGFLGKYCLIIEQYSKHIHVEHCYIEADPDLFGIIVRGGAEEISILNNTFIDGERGLWINQGDINVYPKNIFMTNNVFANQKYAIIGEYANSLFFDGNHITSIYGGIDLRNNNNVQLKNNWVIVTPGPNGWTSAGIYVDGGNTTDIHNNYVSCQGEFPCPGISLNYTYHCEVYFNSINITNTDIAGDNKALWVNCCDQNIVKNNIFNIKHAGYPVYISNSPQNLTLDYNDYCSPSGLIGQVNDTLYYALDTWRVATGQDDHSLAENPYYTSDSDLSMNQILLNNAGIPITGIDYDIDSALRNVTQPDLGAKEYDPCQPDAGINSVSAPTNPVIQGEQNVKVVLQNQGAASLSSAIINWKVNDVIQPPLSWSGTLEINENEEVTLGNYNFQGGVYSLVVWTSQPNGVADCNPNNDTIHAERAVALCGTYTIGGSNPDFTTITEAVTILNIAGVTCPVTFSIRDGIYNEQVVINEIQGSSQQNTITFESESGDSSAVSVQNQGSFIFNLKNTKYINVRKIGFLGKYCLIIEQYSKHIHVEHCYIEADPDLFGIIVRGGAEEISILNNTFIDGERGLWINQGDINVYPKNIFMTNNVFANQKYAIIGEYANSLFFDGNHITSIYGGIDLRNNNNVQLKNNWVIVTPGPNGWTSAGIYVDGGNTTDIHNNYVSCQGEFPCPGISLNYTYHCEVYFNSINITNTDIAGDNKALWVNCCDQNIVKNNIFNIKHAGYPVYISNSPQNLTLDYNDYCSPSGLIGQINGINYNNIAQWGIALNGEANGKNLNPNFVSDSSYKVYQRGLNGAGIPVSGVLLDIEGKIRNDQAPDMGAWEFLVDFGVVDLINPDLNCFHTSSDSVTVLLRQFGDIPFIDLKLAYQVNNGVIHYDTIPGTISNDLAYTFNVPTNMSNAGEYHFKVWLINTLDDNVNNDTLWATRYSKPSPVVVASYDNQCSGNEVFFSGFAQIADPYFIASYEWLFGDGTFSLDQNPVHVYDTAGLYSVVFRAYSDAGCYSEDSLDVFINPNFQAFDVALTLNNEQCYGMTSLDIVASGGTAPYSYFLNGEALSSNHTSPLMPGTYIILVEDDLLCSFSDTLVINPSVWMDPVISANPLSGLPPLVTDFDFSDSGGVSSWEWDFGDGQTSNLHQLSHTYHNLGVFDVALTTNSGAPYYCIETDTVSISVDTTHFIPIWNGNPHNPMMVSVTAAFIQQNNLQPGDEIGIFDANRCVGRAVLSQAIDSLDTNTYAYIICSADDATISGYNGFVLGNEVEYRLWDSSVQLEYTVVDAVYPHDPQFKLEQFTYNETSIVQLNGLRPASLFFISNTSACQGDTLTMEVQTEGMHDVDSLNLIIAYDAVLLEYISYNNVNSVFASDDVSHSSGQIQFIGMGADMEAAEGVLFTLNFVSQDGQSGIDSLDINGSDWCFRGPSISEMTVFEWPSTFEKGQALIRPLPQITEVDAVPVTGCYGNTNGQISINATANTTDIFYSINEGESWSLNQSVFNDLSSGDYLISVRDTFLCQTDYDNNPVQITEPAAITITDVSITEPLCNGSEEGSINITASGGAGSLQYSIDNGANWQTSNQFAGLMAGDYSITVKDANNCQMNYNSNPVTITEPIAVTITDVSITEPLCNDSAEGSINITATGGTGGLQYSIDNGSNWQNSNQFTGLIAGDFNITVKDENDCQINHNSNPVTITEPTAVTITDVSITEPLCNGSAEGSINITASGGTGSLQYSIDNGSNWQASNQFVGLMAGDYTITVKDANDCQINYNSNPVTITEPAAITITDVSITEPLCNGSAEGSINITASGGTGSLQYSIDNGSNWQASNQFVGLMAGDYTITVKDANDCQINYNSNPVAITEPAAITITDVSITEPLCNGSAEGSINITASGGAGSLQYSIDNGANWQTSNQFTGLMAGDYNITLKDANDCQINYSGNPVTITEPSALIITEVGFNKETSRGASDATITISASGGSTPLQYSVDSGLSWQENDGIYSTLDSGDYQISVRDANFCQIFYSGNPVHIPGVHFDRIWGDNPLNPMYFSITHAMAEDMDLEWLDEIAIYDGSYCVGTVVLTQSIDSLNNVTYASINCSQDESGTPEKEGYTPGHQIRYRLWDESAHEEYIYVCADYPYTPNYANTEFTTGATDIAQLFAQPAVAQQSGLAQGWNIISWNVVPINMSMDSLLEPLTPEGSLIKVIDEQGHIMQELPWGWINMIGDMQQTEGYQVKVSTDSYLTTNGYAVLLPIEIPFSPSWNIMSWPLQTAGNAESAMQLLIDEGSLEKVIDENGNILQQLPWGWVNTIGDFAPGKGYQVRVSNGCQLALDEDAGDFKSYIAEQPKAQYIKTLQKGNPYNPMAFALRNNDNLPQNTEIGVYYKDQCFGAAVLTGDYIYITAGTDEADTDVKEGFGAGDAFHFKYITEGMQEAKELEVSYIEGDKTFIERGTFVGEIKSTTAIETIPNTSGWFGEARPNPTRNEVFVDIFLSEASNLHFILMDSRGKIVMERSIEKPSGMHEQSIDLSKLLPGMYFLKMQMENESGYLEKVVRIVRI